MWRKKREGKEEKGSKEKREEGEWMLGKERTNQTKNYYVKKLLSILTSNYLFINYIEIYYLY